MGGPTRGSRDVPLNCVGNPGLPPKTAILVLWRSFMSVLNMAQVEAQLPLPTIQELASDTLPANDTRDTDQLRFCWMRSQHGAI